MSSEGLKSLIVTDPDSLKDLVALKSIKRGTKREAIILAKLGGSIFTLPDDGATIPPKEAVIESEIGSVQNLRGLFNRDIPVIDETAPDNRVQLQTPNINPNLFAQAPTGIATLNQGLTPSESAFLREEDKQIRLRSRGLA